jgi:hypothetical protein
MLHRHENHELHLIAAVVVDICCYVQMTLLFT